MIKVEDANCPLGDYYYSGVIPLNL